MKTLTATNRTGTCRAKRNSEQCVLLSVFLLLVLVIMFHCAASYAANQQPASPKAPAAPAKSAPPQQQPASPPSQQPPASQEPSPTVQAIQVLRAEIAIDSLDPRLRYELANALHDAGDKEEALLQYDKALSLKPDLKEALVNRGAVLNELGRVVEAIDSFEKALALAPRDTKALVNLGNSLYALQRYDEAIKRYKLSVAADSTFGEGYYYVGIAFADAGIYREAVREWERILVVAPNSEAAKNARENLDTLKNFLTSEVKPGTRPKME